MKKTAITALFFCLALFFVSCRQVNDKDKIVPTKGPTFVSGALFEEKVEIIWGYLKDYSTKRNNESYTKNYLGSTVNAEIKLIEIPISEMEKAAHDCDILQVDKDTASSLAAAGLLWDLSEVYSRGFFSDYKGESPKWYLNPVSEYEDKKGAGFFVKVGIGLSSNNTFDEMFYAMEKAPDNKVAIAALWSPERLFSLMAYPYGISYTPDTAAVYNAKEQKWECDLQSDKVEALLSRLSVLHQKGKLKFFEREDFEDALSKEEVLSFFDYYRGSGYVPVTLKNPDGETRGYYDDIAAGNRVFCISAFSDTKEQAAHFLNFLYTDYGAEITNFGVRGLTWEISDTKQSAEFVYKEVSPLIFEPGFIFFDTEYDLGKNRLAARILDRREAEITFFNEYNRQNSKAKKAFLERRFLCPSGYSQRPCLPPLEKTKLKRAKTLIEEIAAAVSDMARGRIFSASYEVKGKIDEITPQCRELERILNGEN